MNAVATNISLYAPELTRHEHGASRLMLLATAN